LRYSRSTQEIDKDTSSRSIVAMLGLDMIGASRKGGLDTPMVHPSTCWV
jgi:hypothetical protein